MHLIPTQSYLLCSIHEGAELGIIQLPGTSAELQPYAKILRVGPLCNLAIGTKILFAPQNVIYTEQKGDLKLVMVPEGCVFATYEDEGEPVELN